LRHFGLLESGFKDKLDKKLCIQDFDFIYSGNDSTWSLWISTVTLADP
jgi:hypothetical protein